jgi:uracil DNA glycosylase
MQINKIAVSFCSSEHRHHLQFARPHPAPLRAHRDYVLPAPFLYAKRFFIIPRQFKWLL